MSKKQQDAELGYRAWLASNSREPGHVCPGPSEFGVAPRRGGETTWPGGSRYRPTAATESVRKPAPYWHSSGELVDPE